MCGQQFYLHEGFVPNSFPSWAEKRRANHVRVGCCLSGPSLPVTRMAHLHRCVLCVHRRLHWASTALHSGFLLSVFGCAAFLWLAVVNVSVRLGSSPPCFCLLLLRLRLFSSSISFQCLSFFFCRSQINWSGVINCCAEFPRTGRSRFPGRFWCVSSGAAAVSSRFGHGSGNISFQPAKVWFSTGRRCPAHVKSEVTQRSHWLLIWLFWLTWCSVDLSVSLILFVQRNNFLSKVLVCFSSVRKLRELGGASTFSDPLSCSCVFVFFWLVRMWLKTCFLLSCSGAACLKEFGMKQFVFLITVTRRETSH